MVVTFVVRLAPRPLAEGSIVGHVVDVATGERTVIQGADDLVSFLRGYARATATKPCGG